MTDEAGRATTNLVGRTAALESVVRLLDEGSGGVAGSLLVSGEAGIGKTALLHEAAELASTHDVVRASCLPMSTLSVPFLPLTSALRRRADHDILDAVQAGPGHALTAFDGWLDRLCTARPVLLVVDDLHWADESSLDVLLYVLAGPADRRLTAVMSVRSGEAGGRLSEWLANVRRLPRVTELRLDRLDRFGVQEQLTALLGRVPRSSLVDEIHGRTDGNPYLTELLVQDLPPEATTLPEGLPSDLHEAVASTWRRLTPNARALTSLLAVSGHPQTLERLERLAAAVGVRGDPLRLARESVDGGVLERREGTYWFRHPLLAEVLGQELLPEERQRLHASLARSLTATLGRDDADIEGDVDAGLAVDLADHHAGAGHRHEAFRWALVAARSAERAGGPAEALRLLRRARAMGPEVGSSTPGEVGLLERIVAVAQECGVADAAIDAVDRLLELAEGDHDPVRVAGLLIRRIELGYEAGSLSKGAAVGWAQRAVHHSAAAAESAEHASAVALLAEAEVWSGVATGSERAARAVSLAGRTGSSKALALALIARSTSRAFAGEAGAVEDALAAEDAAAAAGDFRTYLDAVCAANNSIDIGFTNPIENAHARQSRERLAAMGAPQRYQAVLAAGDAFNVLMSGDWRACTALLRVALGSSPGPEVDCVARLTAAILDIRQGRWSRGEQHLARAVELPDAPYEFFGYHAIRAELEIAKGDDRAAVDAAMAGITGQRANLTEHLLPLAARALANQAQDLRDRGRDASPVLAALRDLRSTYPHVVHDVGPGASHAAAIVAMQAMYDAEDARARDISDAPQLWRRAAEACAQARLAWDEAYAWWRAAQAALRTRVASPEARELVRRSHRMAAELGAATLQREIEELAQEARVPMTDLPAHDGGSPSPIRKPIPGLTTREHDVLLLVMAGRTYAEIAAELFISEKTVSSHISHMLRKTNTTSRIQLAQLARRLSSS